jgi:hypothetical protein
VASSLLTRRRCATATPATPAPPQAEAAAAPSSTAAPMRLPPKTAPKAVRIANRELSEEANRPEKPPKPSVPRGWAIEHAAGRSFFTMKRQYENDLGTVEAMRLYCAIEIKDPERTYRQDDGEREDPEHFNFQLQIMKPNANGVGALDFALTSIDGELLLDSMSIHSNMADADVAFTRTVAAGRQRDGMYRGPYINELDDDFTDEILNYLDDRGVHNAFAEFVQMQAHYTEQEEYEHWLLLLRGFAAQPKLSPAPAATDASKK